jgi:hypothetical protein
MTRRDDRAYREYVREEQRSQRECIAGRTGSPARQPRWGPRMQPAFHHGLLASQVPQGMVRTVLIDNGTVLVTRLGYEAGKGETSHTHPFSAVVMQLTPGDVDMTIGSDHSRSVDTKPFELLSVAIK